MPLRADRDLTWTDHAVLLSLPLPDPWSRPCTGDIMHPLRCEHHMRYSHTLQPHFTDTCTLLCAWPRPAVLGFRDGNQQLGHDNLTFWDCRARSAHRARPLWGRRGRRPLYVVGGSSRKVINQLASRLFASLECLLCATASVRSSTGSPRGGTTSFPYMSGLYSGGACWPPHRWPIEPRDQAGNSRDISVAHKMGRGQWKAGDDRRADTLASRVLGWFASSMTSKPPTPAVLRDA